MNDTVLLDLLCSPFITTEEARRLAAASTEPDPTPTLPDLTGEARNDPSQGGVVTPAIPERSRRRARVRG